MKFLHLGDLHLGKTLDAFHLIDDQRYMLNQILEIVRAQRVDAVLIAGDVYDKRIPSVEAVNLLDEFLFALSKEEIDTYVISGNHDSEERLNFGSRLLSENHLYISTLFDGKLKKYQKIKETEHGCEKVNIYLMPYIRMSTVQYLYKDEKIDTYSDAVRSVIAHSDIQTEETNILVAHQFVAGRDSQETRIAGSESISTQTVGTIQMIGYDCFDVFDYVALGHIHSPQRVGRDEVRYAGSPLKYSDKEAMDEKSVPVITIGENQQIDIELIPLTPLRDIRRIKGPINELLNEKNVRNPDDFIYVTLTDEEIISDAIGRFRNTYPNTVSIKYDNSHTHEIDAKQLDLSEGKKSFDELIQEFYEKIYGTQMSEEELKVMKEVAREAGVIHEAN